EVALPKGRAPSSPEIAPPALVRPPPSTKPIAPQVTPSPWVGREARGGPTVGESAAAAVAKELTAPMGKAPAAGGGALEASNAAAGREIRRPEPAPAPRKVEPMAPEKPKAPPEKEVIRLLWFDAAIVPRMRKHAKWRRLLLESDLSPSEQADAVDE